MTALDDIVAFLIGICIGSTMLTVFKAAFRWLTASEREACAKIAESKSETHIQDVAQDIADIIRARSKP